MRSYINEHIEKRVYGYIHMQKRSIKIGNIINFYYPDSQNNKNPHVIILNPRFQDKMHCLVLDYMTLKDVDLFRSFIIEEVKEVETNEPKTFIPALRMLSTESQTPESFYRVRLKNYLMNKIKKDIYRTYKWDSIKRIRLVAYQWGVK
jgi:hypothetical protein